MIHREWLEYGAVFMVRHEFERAGEGLPMHQHCESERHNLVVLQGAVTVRGEGETWYYSAGEIAELPERHEIVAREDRTVTLSLYRNGKPEEYGLMPSEASVSFENPLMRWSE